MIITDKEYGRFDVCLCDDGTLDTVVEICMVDAPDNTRQEIRFSDTAHYRDNETGAMTDEGFAELAQEAVEAYIEKYLI